LRKWIIIDDVFDWDGKIEMIKSNSGAKKLLQEFGRERFKIQDADTRTFKGIKCDEEQNRKAT
jgi:hypothetical protein